MYKSGRIGYKTGLGGVQWVEDHPGLPTKADHKVSIGGVFLALLAAAWTAVALGTTVAHLLVKEMEGTLLLFFFAGLQAVLNPFGRVATFFPF